MVHHGLQTAAQVLTTQHIISTLIMGWLRIDVCIHTDTFDVPNIAIVTQEDATIGNIKNYLCRAVKGSSAEIFGVEECPFCMDDFEHLIFAVLADDGDELLVKKASEDYCRITQTTPFLKMTIRDTTRFATQKTSLWCGTKALLDSERHRRKALLDSEKHRRNSQAAVSRTPSPPPPPLPMGPPGILLDVDIHGLRKHLSHLLQNNWRSRACAESIRQWQLSIDTASDEGSVGAEYHRINHMMTALGAQGYFLHPRRDKKRLTNRTL